MLLCSCNNRLIGVVVGIAVVAIVVVNEMTVQVQFMMNDYGAASTIALSLEFLSFFCCCIG
jgi:hypothetical protein